MKEKLKIIIDDEGFTHVWIDGKKQRYVTKITVNVESDSIHYPRIIIEKDNFDTDILKNEERKRKLIMM